MKLWEAHRISIASFLVAVASMVFIVEKLPKLTTIGDTKNDIETNTHTKILKAEKRPEIAVKAAFKAEKKPEGVKEFPKVVLGSGGSIIQNPDYVFFKRLIIYTEGYYQKAYADGTFYVKNSKGGIEKTIKNFSVGYGSSAIDKNGKLIIKTVANEAQAWALAEKQLSDCVQLSKNKFPLLKPHQHLAVGSLFYKAGIYIFDLPKTDKRYAKSEEIRAWLSRGELPPRSYLEAMWVSLKNNVGNHKETRILELDLLYKDANQKRYLASLDRLMDKT